MFGSTGLAIGFAVLGFMWKNGMPNELVQYLPPSMKNEAMAVYGDITKQMEAPVGSPVHCWLRFLAFRCRFCFDLTQFAYQGERVESILLQSHW
jgi:small basic protein